MHRRADTMTAPIVPSAFRLRPLPWLPDTVHAEYAAPLSRQLAQGTKVQPWRGHTWGIQAAMCSTECPVGILVANAVLPDSHLGMPQLRLDTVPVGAVGHEVGSSEPPSPELGKKT